MIKLYSPGEVPAGLLEKDVFGTRIAAYYKTYGNKFSFFNVWYQQIDTGEITASISSMEGEGTLTACDNADFEELSAFVDILSLNSLQAQREVLRRLSIKEKLWGYVVRYEGGGKAEKKHIIKKHPQLCDVYEIIKSASLTGVGDYLPWLSDATARVNAGTAEAAGVYHNDKLVCCAMKLFITEKAVLLGAVATNPDFRKMGMAGETVSFLAEECKNASQRAELLCANNGIVNFYKSIGFTITDEWAIG